MGLKQKLIPRFFYKFKYIQFDLIKAFCYKSVNNIDVVVK